MVISDIVIIGRNTRIISPALLSQSTVISSEELLNRTDWCVRAVRAASTVFFASYCRTNEGNLDEKKSIDLAFLVVSLVADPERILFLSSDHVFSGKHGFYSTDDEPDPISCYGKLKKRQEKIFSDGVVLRFTVLGPSFSRRNLITEMVCSSLSLIAYPNAFFSPVSTWTINDVMKDHQNKRLVAGIYHLASERISKAELVCKLAKRIGRSLQMKAVCGVSTDHSLLPSPFMAKDLDSEIDLAVSKQI
ncbi:sugar nucleotide-binding protein [bacterium]|nr:sugar nucleotide-binding protein [bacterium]